jgi:hypothetical protein
VEDVKPCEFCFVVGHEVGCVAVAAAVFVDWGEDVGAGGFSGSGVTRFKLVGVLVFSSYFHRETML